MRNTTVLIVEDNPIEAKDIAAAISKAGYPDSIVCSSGEEAIQYCESNTPLFILMDIGLSGEIDGIETAEKIIKEHNIPVIYLTASSDDETIDRTKDTYPYGFLLKPVSNRFMHITIEMALNRYDLESQLVKNRNLVNLTLNSILEAVIAVEQGGTIIYINDQALKIIGLDKKEALKKNIKDIYLTTDPQSGALLDCTPMTVMETGESVIYRESRELISKNNHKTPISENCSPLINSRHQLFGAVLVFQDISLKKQSDNEKLKNRKMESMSKLARGLAHDFNNILTGVIGNVSMLRMIMETTEPPVQEIINEIEKSSNRARDLANQIRLFAKGSAPIKKAADLNSIITDTGTFILSGSDLKLNISTNANTDHLKFDPDQMSQVFENMFLNVKEASQGPNTVNVIITKEIIGSTSAYNLQSGNYIRIDINDFGKGITTESADQIFDPFFTTKSKAGGMGLSNAYNTVKAHGGTIVLKSLQSPTSFSIFLPIEIQTKLQNKNIIPIGSHIIIVDDEKSILIMLEKMLKALHYTPHLFTHPKTALDYINANRDLCPKIKTFILDLSIPGSEGAVSLLKSLKPEFPDATYILISGHQTENPVIADYQKFGFNALIQKPFSFDDLKILLNR
ncbi:MAG TPA: response regulator [Spirochaetota bacterium]|nr:response regulator [Spirochaetota bacterium]